jgi:hypothetical protein
MNTQTKNRVMNTLWIIGFAVVLVSTFIGNSTTAYLGIVFMGVVLLIFNYEMSDVFIKLYKTANPTFIRYLTVFVSFVFIAVGILGTLNINFN